MPGVDSLVGTLDPLPDMLAPNPPLGVLAKGFRLGSGASRTAVVPCLAANDSNRPARSFAGLLSGDSPVDPPSPRTGDVAPCTPTLGTSPFVPFRPLARGEPNTGDDCVLPTNPGRVGDADLDRSLYVRTSRAGLCPGELSGLDVAGGSVSGST